MSKKKKKKERDKTQMRVQLQEGGDEGGNRGGKPTKCSVMKVKQRKFSKKETLIGYWSVKLLKRTGGK